MAITIGFCVSYIPQFIILFWEIKERNFLFDISKHNTAILSLIRELAIVNHIMNAFIYGYYDRKFREEIKKVFKCFKSINQQ
jgi:aspartate carbamoyltransferase regulatory subunit